MTVHSLTPAAQVPHAPQNAATPRWGRTRHAFSLFSRYWTSRDWKFAWFALIMLLTITLSQVYFAVWMIDWERRFFDSVERRQAALFLPLVGTFAAIFLSRTLAELANQYLGMAVGLRWRVCLTERYVDRWFARDRFYAIERLNLIDNPDQRIADDVQRFTAGVLNLVIGGIYAVVSAISFGAVLLATSEAVRFSLFGRSIALPGDMIWYAVLYAIGGSIAIIYIGRPFVRRQMRQQHYEADFRTAMLHVRRNASQISFARAPATEARSLRDRFDAVRHNFVRVVWSELALIGASNGYQQFGSFFPLLLTVPRYFAGRITFGEVMAANSTFLQLSGSLSWFISSYSPIGEQVANVSRLKALDDALDGQSTRGIDFGVGTDDGAVALRTSGLRIDRPAGGTLLDVGDWRVAKGERWVIQGPSGMGKSTLLRAIAGLWPEGAGGITMGRHRLLMFVPQRLYLPHASLKDAICFPDDGGAHDDATVLAILREVRLHDHAGDLHAVRQWQEQLSPGEQQRIAMARILLHRPDMLVVDEATSALDEDNAHHFHQAILAQLPELTLISVIHDDRLVPYHTHRLDLADGKATAGRLENDE
ncbi:ABC transporter ATP-binding protein/permease [Sphingomonas montana]|uniref:ABC transporter ATP-binding protein/permease n=1 Tax=Sphingomonas montana TaxID=1843236 RepID=UPI00096E414E|nr:ABC transporter ATP-binding protein/permease [Sphingomonas montana]